MHRLFFALKFLCFEISCSGVHNGQLFCIFLMYREEDGRKTAKAYRVIQTSATYLPHTGGCPWNRRALRSFGKQTDGRAYRQQTGTMPLSVYRIARLYQIEQRRESIYIPRAELPPRHKPAGRQADDFPCGSAAFLQQRIKKLSQKRMEELLQKRIEKLCRRVWRSFRSGEWTGPALRDIRPAG